MQPKHADINVLLASLLLFSLVIGGAYSIRSQEGENTHNIEELLLFTRPSIISGSIEKIVKFLKNFPPKISYEVALRIIEEEESALNQQDKEQLIFALVQAFAKNTDIQKKLLDLLFKLDTKIETICLVHCAAHGYHTIIPTFISWAKEHEKEHPELKDIAQQALFTAIDKNNVKALSTLITHGKPIDVKKASQLIWYAIFNNKNPAFIPFLAKQGADLWSSYKGHTLMTKAATLNNKETIDALISTLKQQGVPQKRINQYINRFVDKTIGTPLQIAIEKGFTNLELYLREQGGAE